jgi:hypothetical protein
VLYTYYITIYETKHAKRTKTHSVCLPACLPTYVQH